MFLHKLPMYTKSWEKNSATRTCFDILQRNWTQNGKYIELSFVIEISLTHKMSMLLGKKKSNVFMNFMNLIIIASFVLKYKHAVHLFWWLINISNRYQKKYCFHYYHTYSRTSMSSFLGCTVLGIIFNVSSSIYLFT